MTGWRGTILSLALGWAMPATGGKVAVRLQFDAPAGCSSSDAFFSGLVARTSRVRKASADDDALELHVRINVRRGRVHGELATSDGTRRETRAVDGRNCDEVVEALSLTAALAIDPNARIDAAPPDASPSADGTSGERATPSNAGRAPTETNDESERDTPTEERPRKPPVPDERAEDPEDSAPDETPDSERGGPAEPFRVQLGAQLYGASLLGSDVESGAAVVARVAQRSDALFSPSFGVAILHARNDLFGSALDADAHWTGAAVTLCPARFALAPALDLRPCALGVGAWLVLTGNEVARPSSRGRTWWSAGGSLRAELALDRQLSLELDAGLAVSLVQRRFITAEPQLFVGETRPVVPMGSLGLVSAF